MRIPGIYKIQSITFPDRIYIGSAIDMDRRWTYHKTRLNKGVHENSKLQNHVSKYGINDLVHSVLHVCADEELIIAEQFFIDSYNPYFNICKIAWSTLGRPSLLKGIKTGFVPSSAFKKGHIPKHKGTKGMFPNLHKGEKLSEEVKNNMSEGMRLYWKRKKELQSTENATE